MEQKEKDRCDKAIEIIQAFRDDSIVEVFYETANGFQRCFTIGAVLEALRRNRSVRVLAPDLLTVILRY